MILLKPKIVKLNVIWYPGASFWGCNSIASLYSRTCL